VSGVVVDLLHGYADQYNGYVEQVSCDECYLEININSNDIDIGNDVFAFANSIAENIRADIFRNTACTASIGVGPNKVRCGFFVHELSFPLHQYFYFKPLKVVSEASRRYSKTECMLCSK
jgi:nucleotidyltransferase/DNA polymerase involved in DNA repair